MRGAHHHHHLRGPHRQPGQSSANARKIFRAILMISGAVLLSSAIILPYIILQSDGVTMNDTNDNNNNGKNKAYYGVSSHLRQSPAAIEIFLKNFEEKKEELTNEVKEMSNEVKEKFRGKIPMLPLSGGGGGGGDKTDDAITNDAEKQHQHSADNKETRSRKIPPPDNEAPAAFQHLPLQPPVPQQKDERKGDARSNDAPDDANKPVSNEAAATKTKEFDLARGVAGLPMSETPALEGARRAKIQCGDGYDDADFLAYWNEPQGTRDLEFRSPFASEEGSAEKYITFEPDHGGWNNIRMTLEIIFIFAVATGRTLVLPPDQPLYLLKADKSKKQRNFADFFPFRSPQFAQSKLNIITTEEFLRREGGTHGRLPINEDLSEKVLKAQSHCEQRLKSDISCMPLFDHLRDVGTVLPLKAGTSCLVFDLDAYEGGEVTKEHEKNAIDFCTDREITYFSSSQNEPTLLHFQSSEKEFRILSHFYGFLHFTDPAIDNFYKRFVRDYMHYIDPIFCAAGKIIRSLQEESKARGFDVDEEGGGGYSSLHVRRGELQYKRVKISAEEWYENTHELWKENEILFIATDERNKTFFDPIKEHHDVKFLDDYWDMANLGDLDPNYMGMIDTIVASRGRIFVGTYFSTFTGYITRMRGYHGMSMKDSYYGDKKYKMSLQEWKPHKGTEFSHEWPSGWIGIDGDTVPLQDKF